MEKEKFNILINEINKIARLNILQYKIEKIVEEYNEFIEDFYFNEINRIGYFVVIPATVLFNNELKPNEKL